MHGSFALEHVGFGLIPTVPRSDRREGPSRGVGRTRVTMEGNNTTHPAESILSPRGAQSATTSLASSGAPKVLAPTTPGEASGDREEVEALRRQIVALQRISTLGVLAGGVFHELNNALTPVLNYAKLALRNPDPASRERALTQIVEAAQRAATITRSMLGLS